MNARHLRKRAGQRRLHPRGFTLIELMVAMLLGLIVIAGVSSVFLANLRSYHSNTALSDVQSNARLAFTMMARDIRQAGLTGCNSVSGRIANVLKNGPHGGGTIAWWADWGNAVHGYGINADDPAVTTGAAQGDRIAGTDSLTLLGATDEGLSIKSDAEPAGNIVLNNKSSDLQKGDIVMVCDPSHSTIMQATSYSNDDVTLTHTVGGNAPGNCSQGLGYPTACTAGGNAYTFGSNAMVSRIAAEDWYIGNNPVGGRSLYRMDVSNQGGVPTAQAQEMVRNVTNMQITYHEAGVAGFDDKFVDASQVTDWAAVDAVHIQFTLQSIDQRAGTNQQPLIRTFASTISIRNRT